MSSGAIMSLRKVCGYLFVLALIVVSGSACGNAGADRVLVVETDGVLVGLAYFDANATREFDTGDEPLAGVGIALLAAGTSDTVEKVISAGDGQFSFPAIPVGSYEVVVDTATIGDSVIVADIDDAEVNITPGDSARVNVAISFPLLTIGEARLRPVGKKIFVDGIALNSWPTFGDSTIHIADITGSMRSIRAGPGAVSPGDSIRLRGTVSTRSGQKVLDLDRRVPTVLQIAELPAPAIVTTGVAASADGGVLDAAFVRLDSARIADTATVNQDLVVTVDDGVGQLEVVFDGDAQFDPGSFLLPGADIAVTGLLVPTGTGTWRLKPRSDIDVAITPPVISIVAARNAALGAIVFVDGIALNFWAAFGDSTIHISDNTGSMRGTRVEDIVSVFPGDSVRFVGKIRVRDGQPVIDEVSVFSLGFSRVPPPQNVSTFEANAARVGTLDAALVSLANATISDTVTAAAGFHATVNDGSGPVVVEFDRDIPFNVAPYVPGARLNATGLLVPSGFGTWLFKPRAPGDVQLQ